MNTRYLSIFPNNKSIAEYDSLNQCITLEELTRANLNTVMKAPLDATYNKHYRILAHEINHYFDHIGTLRGQQLLLDTYNAYNALYEPTQTEQEMYRVVDLHNHVRRLKYESYYKKIDMFIENDRVESWSFSPTIGKRYGHDGRIDSNRPILFYRYSYNGQFVTRMPVGIESLWECSSVAVELEVLSTYLNNISEDERLVETRLAEKEYVKQLYNSELLEYSNIVHPIAKHIVQTGDLLHSYHMTKTIASVILNLPDKYFNLIKIPQYINSSFHKSDIINLKKNREIAFLYFCIVQNIIEAGPLKSLDDILLYSNLPDKDVLENEIIREMTLYRRRITDGNYKTKYLELIDAGIEIFKSRGLFNTFDYLKLASEGVSDLPIICIDEICNTTGILNWIYEADILNKRALEFVNACGY